MKNTNQIYGKKIILDRSSECPLSRMPRGAPFPKQKRRIAGTRRHQSVRHQSDANQVSICFEFGGEFQSTVPLRTYYTPLFVDLFLYSHNECTIRNCPRTEITFNFIFRYRYDFLSCGDELMSRWSIHLNLRLSSNISTAYGVFVSQHVMYSNSLFWLSRIPHQRTTGHNRALVLVLYKTNFVSSNRCHHDLVQKYPMFVLQDGLNSFLTLLCCPGVNDGCHVYGRRCSLLQRIWHHPIFLS